MGVEYAIVCDKTREALDLGKGPWWELFEDEQGNAIDPTESLIRRHVNAWITGWNRERRDFKYASDLTTLIWDFVRTHPGCRVVSDCGDSFWAKDARDEEQLNTFGPENCYLQIASRYDIKVEGA